MKNKIKCRVSEELIFTLQWRAYLSTSDFKHAWSKSKSLIETIFDKVNDGLTAINATVMDTIKNTKFQAIYFGTLWCGDGTKARENREVGYFYQTGNFYFTYSNL
jgi:hypothetical protein